jgi:5,10-methylenetetrahydromethanopterin reductase
MPLEISCAFAPSMNTPAQVALAEQLGYKRAWLYDSPALYPDVWVQLARAADRTSTIGLGTGVLIPSLRHPMTTAAAIGTLVDIAGADRVVIGVGSGFTGRLTLGQRPLPWARVREWITCVQGLLAGDTVTWEGGRMRMLQPEGFGPQRPIAVPFLVAAAGPKGQGVAREVADGVLMAGGEPMVDMAWQTMLTSGTVLDVGENADSERVRVAAGHAAAVAYHFVAENNLGVEGLLGGAEWLAAYDDVDRTERHLELHDLHLIGVNERDAPFITPEVITVMGCAFSPAQLGERLAAWESAGISEVAYQPAGPDIERELDAYMTAARG